MKIRQLLRLRHDTPAIDNNDSKATLTIVPKGAIISITGARNPDNPNLVEVESQDHCLYMFADDVQERGEKIIGADEP